MRKIVLFLPVALLAGALVTCTDRSSNPENSQIRATLSQIPGCQSPAVFSKAAFGDSCFSYQFSDELVVDFCLTGNCCPDSDRFKLVHEIRNDTIYVIASDTARHLCKCICNYVIHAEFENLPHNHYVFHCTREDYSDRVVFYSQHLYRNHGID